jgi:hypothetical protein
MISLRTQNPEDTFTFYPSSTGAMPWAATEKFYELTKKDLLLT